ncbi:hypothetical protein GOBAR_AA20934 [Gossypium barbadense]|uniref:Zinc knuckle CX2CX4HX4C domain-containing protein n=1 Tax=Gossypium barbadense TaxID=3634 RepID=A0A2P5X8S5_GOSBA|nr:hypothetical protein GOBAR_AA20934 [Gossypium barbadense]
MNGDNNMQGFESWAVGKIMVTEIPNREAMYRVFCSLWYTKEEVDFEALKEGVVIGKGFGLYDFRMSPFWLRVYNLPLEFMDRQMAVDVGNALGELVAIDWKDRFGGWTEFIRIKVKIDILKLLRRVVRIIDKDGGEKIGVIKYERLPDFCYVCGLIGHTLKMCSNNKGVRSKPQVNEKNAESLTNSREECEQHGAKRKEKAYEEESMSTSPWKEESIRPMEGCLVVSSEGKSGGLALLWREGVNVLKATSLGYAGRVKSRVNEASIVGGDFNVILNNSEKEGGRRKPKIQMDEFKMARLVKKRLDHFAISEVVMEKMPFLLSHIVRQSKSDHEAILMDTNGSKPKEKGVDHRMWFRYDTCWGKEDGAKDIINSIRKKNSIERLKYAHGVWHDDKLEICHIAWSYFYDLFKTSITRDIESDLHYVLVCINEDMNRRLNREFTNEEILMAFKQMNPHKALGIDELSGSFFKEH